MATAIFGGLTPYAAQLLVERTGWALAPGAMIAWSASASCRLPDNEETAPHRRSGR
jgi:MHS family proline/betaine transporter-like MFS transporter